MIVKLVAVFLLSLAIGILYRVPKSSLVYGAVVGVIGWFVFFIIINREGSIYIGCFLGSLMVALMSEMLARYLRKPATIFLIPGFIPLVPGREAYFSMLAIISGNYADGLAMAIQTALMGGAIAMGIFVISTFMHTISSWQKKGEYGDAS